jgi:methylated-DNA-protein-cysteine methyltransferase-like protein
LVGYVLKHLDKESSIPWHRVINSQGKISVMRINEKGGNIQQQLLADEGIYLLNNKINLKVFSWIP